MGVGEGTGEGKGTGLVEGSPDMEIRDPNNINDHLKVAFEDVLAEPIGTYSNDCVWICAYNCYNGAKLCCYRCLTVFCGWCCALCWGCQFACLTFQHIWHYTPSLRVFSVNCGYLQKVWAIVVHCYLAPMCETFALLFSRVNVVNSQG